MRRRAIVIGVGAVLAVLHGAGHAQEADFARATCDQFNRLPAADRSQVALWLHGYYAGAAQRPSLDRSQLDEAVSNVKSLCEAEPQTPLLGQKTGALLRGERVPRERAPASSNEAAAPPSPAGTPPSKPTPQ